MAIRCWLEKLGDEMEGTAPLFVSLSKGGKAKGKRLSGDAINEIVKRVFGREWSAHGLRSRGITDCFTRSGGNHFYAQAFARHSNPATTQTYIDVEKAKEAGVFAPDYS